MSDALTARRLLEGCPFRSTLPATLNEEAQVHIDAFQRAWPSTIGRRVRKQRHRVRDGALVWEVDRFLDWPLWMAEVELPGADAAAPVPA